MTTSLNSYAGASFSDRFSFDLLHPGTVAKIADDLAAALDRSFQPGERASATFQAYRALDWLRHNAGVVEVLRLDNFADAGATWLPALNSGEAAEALIMAGEDPIGLLSLVEWLLDLFGHTPDNRPVMQVGGDLDDLAELQHNADRAGWDRYIPSGLYVGAYAVAAAIADPASGVGVDPYLPASLAIHGLYAVDMAFSWIATMNKYRDRYQVATVDGDLTGGSYFTHTQAGRVSVGFDAEDRAWYVRLDTQDRGAFTWGRLDLYSLVQVLIGCFLAE